MTLPGQYGAKPYPCDVESDEGLDALGADLAAILDGSMPWSTPSGLRRPRELEGALHRDDP